MKYLSKFLSLVAIAALVAGSFASLAYTTQVYANNGLTVSAVPSTGTLAPGDSLEVQIADPSGTTDAVADLCLVNGVDVTGTFSNVSPGLYHVTYTVGASDSSAAAGMVPIDCTLHQAVSVHVTSFDDGNTVAIDTASSTSGGAGDTGGTGTTTPSGGTGGTGTGTTTPAAPLFSQVSLVPATGTSTAGSLIEAYFTEASGAGDLALAGECKINNVDVSSSFQNLTGGLYKVSYTVGSSDGERPAGHIPVTCTLGNAGGTVAAHAWTDSNTLAIDTNGDGAIDNGTSTLGFTVEAVPSTGTIQTGGNLEVYFNDPLPSEDVVISGACTVNGVDVSGSYQNLTGGLYKVTYTVAHGDADRASGTVPVDCTLQNHTGSVHLTYFTDDNTVAIDSSATLGGGTGDTGGTGTTTPSGGTGGTGSTGGTSTSTPSGLISAVSVVPGSGTLVGGNHADIYFDATGNANDLTLSGACRVNNVDVSSTFQNLTGGLYKVLYTVGPGDADRASGNLPISCGFQNEAGTTTAVTAFTDGNTVTIDANNDGTITEPTGNNIPFIHSVSAVPNTGTLDAGGHLEVYLQEGNGYAGFSVGSCTVNGVDVSSTFQDLTDGLYKVTYTVGSSDADRSAGAIPVDCTLHGNGAESGQSVSTYFGFTDSNTVAVHVTQSGSTGGTGGTGSTGGTGGTGSTGGTGGVTTPSILWASITPSSGTLHAGDSAQVYFQESHNMTDLAINGSCTVNGSSVSMDTLDTGLYRLNYTVGSSDADRAAGTIPVSCALRNSGGATTSINSLASNSLAVQVSGSAGTTTSSGGSGSIGGTVNGGADAALAVTAIDQISGVATAGGGYANGWSWVFHITVPNAESSLSLKFGDWTQSSGSATISAAGNMRVSSLQAASTSPVTITAANAYSTALGLNSDLDPSTPGRQIEVKVEMQVPAGAANGSYSTSYGVKSVQ